jgi:hypothetical protein
MEKHRALNSGEYDSGSRPRLDRGSAGPIPASPTNMKGNMNLLEILNTKAAVKWTTIDNQHSGEFELEGDDNKYVIQIHEYHALGKEIVDLGFTANGNIDATNDKKNASKIIGAVLNGSIEKLKRLNPDAILVSILKSFGLTDSRKSLYSTVLVWASRRFGYSFQTEWLENSKMQKKH